MCACVCAHIKPPTILMCTDLVLHYYLNYILKKDESFESFEIIQSNDWLQILVFSSHKNFDPFTHTKTAAMTKVNFSNCLNMLNASDNDAPNSSPSLN